MTSKTVPTLFFTSPLLQVPLMGQSVSTASAAEEAAEAAAAAPIKDSNPPSRPRWDTDMLLRTANTTANTATTACVPACVPAWRPCWVRCLHDAEPAVAAFPLEVRVALDLALQALPRHHVTGSQPHLCSPSGRALSKLNIDEHDADLQTGLTFRLVDRHTRQARTAAAARQARSLRACSSTRRDDCGNSSGGSSSKHRAAAATAVPAAPAAAAQQQ